MLHTRYFAKPTSANNSTGGLVFCYIFTSCYVKKLCYIKF